MLRGSALGTAVYGRFVRRREAVDVGHAESVAMAPSRYMGDF